MTPAAISADQLTRSFKTVQAVDKLSLEVPAGIIFGFLGPNGAGKTTTIRLLMGLLEASSGSARVLGFDVRTQADEIRQCTGALLEQSGLYERLSAEDNLEFYARIWHMPLAERRTRISQLLEHLGLLDRRKERVGTWSRGMRQKLAIARALLHRPRLIFLDEPTAGLDPVMAAAVRADLTTLVQQEGVTVFLTTHDLAEAEKVCQLVAVIRHGKLLAMGRPDELRRQAGTARVEVIGRGFTPDRIALLRARPEVAAVTGQDDYLLIELRVAGDIAPLTGLLVRAGADIEEVRKGQASLEDVFLSLMQEAA
jgi:ABC-2 type transport system ATP-binding protein